MVGVFWIFLGKILYFGGSNLFWGGGGGGGVGILKCQYFQQLPFSRTEDHKYFIGKNVGGYVFM